MKIFIHRILDLPSCIAVALGEAEDGAQKFALHSTTQTRRLYTVHVVGAIEPGTYAVAIVPLAGPRIVSDQFVVTEEIAPNATIKCEIVAPVLDSFAVQLVRVTPLVAVPDAPIA